VVQDVFCGYLIDIVNGKVNSIMRLVLALAAHYKPNNVRESRRHSSLASDAQVSILLHSVTC